MPRLILTPTNLLEDIRASFWALPAAGLLLAALLAGVTHALDMGRFTGASMRTDGFVGSVHVAAVRQLLVTLAAAAAGITGIAFSVTITTLALASQQFGPQVLRTYMQRRFVQLVLAGFVATVLYALLSLHWLGAAAHTDYLPVVTAATSLALTVMDLMLLVLFIHTTATSIQVDSVIEAVHEDHLSRLPELFPAPDRGRNPATMDGSDIDESLGAGTGHKVHAIRSGYLQTIDRTRVVALAVQYDVRIVVAHEAGVWVARGDTLATVHAPDDARSAPMAGAPLAGSPDETRRLEDRLHRLIVLGKFPTPEQDPRFALRQLQQISLRALSPGINDPQTAASCISRIGAIASDLLARDSVRRRFADAGGTVRLIEHRSDPGELLDFAFDAITRVGSARADTGAELVRTIETLARLHPDSPWLDRLEEQLEWLGRGLEEASFDPVDAERLSGAIRRARARISTARASGSGSGSGSDADADARAGTTTDATNARASRRVTASQSGAAP